MAHVAFVTVHSCPLATLGEKDAGGMNVYALALASAMVDEEFCVDIFTREHDGCDAQVMDAGKRVRVIHVPAGNAGLSKYDLYDALPEFTENVIRFAADEGREYSVVHSHYWLSGAVGNQLREAWEIPHVTCFHTLAEVKERALIGNRESPLRSMVEKRVVSGADAVVAFTPHERDALVRYYGADPEKVAIIPCGVDLELFQPVDKVAARRILGLGDDPIVLFVGRIEPLKGVDILLQAAAMQEDAQNLQVLLIGGEAAENEVRRLKELTAELGLQERASFLGTVPHDQLPLFYSAADVLAVPSYYESFGMVAAEALACGTPVIASKVGGLTSVVRDGETGYLISYRCADTFAERLELLVGNPYLRRSLGEQARPSVEHLAWQRIAGQMTELYASVRPALVAVC